MNVNIKEYDVYNKSCLLYTAKQGAIVLEFIDENGIVLFPVI